MEFHWIWKAVIIVLFGTVVLRVAGRKSISQMTVAQTVLMISIGTLMIQPVSDKNIWITFLIAILLVITLFVIEYLQIKFEKFEKFFSGNAIVIIENGELNIENLKKLRLTVDKLEMRLRQKNVKKIEDVQWATIEPNGEIGYALKKHLQYATKEDIQMVIDLIQAKFPQPPLSKSVIKAEDPNNIFNELKNDKINRINPRKNKKNVTNNELR
ncbi:DUF421 domain-containing protein [Evansella sp. AB-P1]|uniref:DUF421 domain-containing protein n=1 Tax=Evansella sp. AB-P1 TaxID=3037653 RepID=UPI00241D212F|nr:DUF421 domain-containing protein [Evansella sp. AB-P1]MDG5787825.1 DUF421 domain-containing protein [Evansella sp. AB-P1]